MTRWCIVVALVGIVHPAGAEDGTVACKATAPNARISVTFHPDTPISELISWVAGFTCKNVVIDAAVETTGLDVNVKKETIQIKLGAQMRTCPTVADATHAGPPVAVPRVPSSGVVDPAAASDASELEKRVDANIKRIDDTHFEVTKKLVDEFVNSSSSLARSARVVPAVKDGKPDGFKLYAIRPSSLFAKLGFQNGDTLKRINGQDLTSLEKALEVYTKTRTATKFVVDILRRGSPLTITIVVK
jgi:C-terminal processing protease CtpA/Prc